MYFKNQSKKKNYDFFNENNIKYICKYETIHDNGGMSP